MKNHGMNPYLPSWEYVPDGEPHVFGKRVYIYGSHDRFAGYAFCQNDYVCWSAPVDDLTDWQYEGIIYTRAEAAHNEDGRQCLYAPDVTRGPDGRYYLYYALNETSAISVAVCDTPAGKYTYYGDVHYPDGTTLGARPGDEQQFDPGVLTEGETTWLYSGFCPPMMPGRTGALCYRLASDMLTVEQTYPAVVPGAQTAKGTGFEGHAFFEASSIRKVGDVAKPDAKVFRPVQELKGFEKVKLAAGESKCVAIPLDDKVFRYWNTMTNAWEIEGGRYEIRVGASCEDIRLTATVEVAGTGAPNPYAGISLPHYESGKVMNVPDAEWEVLLDCPIPDDTVKIDCNMTLGELKHSRSPLCWLVWLVLHTMLTNSYKQGKPNLNVMFQYNMPLRALAKMTSGAISMGMVDGIVLEAKGFWGIGLCKVLVEAVKNAILNAQLEKRLRDA